MAENSAIEWTTHSYNPWRGCAKVSPGCDHCYAETLSKRNPGALGEWGKDANRVIASEAYWKKPEKWERDAEAFYEAHGYRQRVFCASLGDVFENRPDLAAPRLRLFDLIRRTPSLDWQLLTKRPKNVLPLLRQAMNDAEFRADADPSADHIDAVLWCNRWCVLHEAPANVWLGVSVEDQARADERIPALLKVPAAVRFLSCEPLLDKVDLWPYLTAVSSSSGGPWHDCLGQERFPATGGVVMHAFTYRPTGDIGWVIVGGESGPGKRPFDPDWARVLRHQCRETGTAFFMKQVDKVQPIPDDLLIREFPR